GPIGCYDRGEATAGDRADAAAGVLHDLRLLIGIQPGRGADDEAPGLQCILPNVNVRLLGELVPEDGGPDKWQNGFARRRPSTRIAPEGCSAPSRPVDQYTMFCTGAWTNEKYGY